MWQQVFRPAVVAGTSAYEQPVTGLSAGTTYEFKVGATNSSGTTWSNVLSGLTIAAAPSFTEVARSSSQIELVWSGVPGASSYAIDIEENGNWLPLATLGSGTTSYTVTGLSADTAYRFAVGASNASGISWAYGSPSYTMVAAPTITATAVSASAIDLSWNSVAGVTGYLIDVSANGSSRADQREQHRDQLQLDGLEPEHDVRDPGRGFQSLGPKLVEPGERDHIPGGPGSCGESIQDSDRAVVEQRGRRHGLHRRRVPCGHDEVGGTAPNHQQDLQVPRRTASRLRPGTYEFRVVAVGASNESESNVAAVTVKKATVRK